jgi:hypothetical protein
MWDNVRFVKIINEPKIEFYITVRDGTSFIKAEDNFDCPHCNTNIAVTRKIVFNAFDEKQQAFVNISLPEEVARAEFTKAYNTLTQRIQRAISEKTFWGKVKAIFIKEEIVFPSPNNTLWTIKQKTVLDKEQVEISAELEK